MTSTLTSRSKSPGTMEELFEEINTKYKELEYTLGWSLLYGPYKNLLKPKYPIAFIGLNPAGSTSIPPTVADSISNEEGSSYLVENWLEKDGNEWKGQAPLQKQVQKLFEKIASKLHPQITLDNLLNNSLAANLVPFRSPKWSGLEKKKEAVAFSRGLWTRYLESGNIVAYITISAITYTAMVKILKLLGYLEAHIEKEAIGWGRVKYEITHFTRGSEKTVLVRLPHLSTYKIFSRKECEEPIDTICNQLAAYVNLKIAQVK